MPPDLTKSRTFVKGGRGVAGRGANYGTNVSALVDHLLDGGDEQRHAEVFERPRMAVAGLLDPEILHADHLPEADGPEQVRATFVG